MLPRKKRSRSSTPLWWASASAVISSRFTLALLPHARTDVVFVVRLRETLHRCSKFGLGSVPPCGSTAPSKQRQPALDQLSSAQSNHFMTFEIGAAILLLQGQRQVAKLRKAAVQRGSSDLVDAAPITSGSDAQEAAAAKLRTVFALRNLTGPKLPYVRHSNCCSAACLCGHSRQPRNRAWPALARLETSLFAQKLKEAIQQDLIVYWVCTHLENAAALSLEAALRGRTRK